jgi:hypothetical protein
LMQLTMPRGSCAIYDGDDWSLRLVKRASRFLPNRSSLLRNYEFQPGCRL